MMMNFKEFTATVFSHVLKEENASPSFFQGFIGWVSGYFMNLSIDGGICNIFDTPDDESLNEQYLHRYIEKIYIYLESKYMSDFEKNKSNESYIDDMIKKAVEDIKKNFPNPYK